MTPSWWQRRPPDSPAEAADLEALHTAEMHTATLAAESLARPRDEDLDLFGLTHRGRVRKENEDHFLLCTVHPQVVIHGTSLPDAAGLPLRGERLGTIMLVADGVASGGGGAGASQLATEQVTRYVANMLRCYHAVGTSEEHRFRDALVAAASEAHDAVRRAAAAHPEGRGMATTLTLVAAVWPWAYAVQVGDSRCYVYTPDGLRQVTRDQTMAQDLVDQGALPRERAAASPFAHVLVSAIGGQTARPEITRIALDRPGLALLLCSDGLTKHVPDEQIEREMARMTSSEQLCRTLLQLALDGGGSDNITVIAARALPRGR